MRDIQEPLVCKWTYSMATTDNLAKALGNFPGGDGPLYQQLAQAITLAVERSDLLPGTRLPPERTLAETLKLSRTTVVQAYARLREAGTIESRHGSGTWVRRAGKTGWPSPQEHEVSSAFRRNVVFRSLIERSGDAISFVSAQLPALPEVDVAARAVARRGAASLGKGEGYFPMGLPALRHAVAAHLTRTGLPTREEQVLITNGAQQAISLVAGLLVARGEAVVTEDPTYIGAIDVLVSAGARVLAVPGAAQDLDLDRLRALLAMRPRLLYVVPTYHNPTGGLMPEHTRREIARLAEQLQIPVVEDNTLAELGLAGNPPPPIAALAKDAPILTLGSLSKLFWPGLRVGYIRGPEAWILRLGRFKALSDLGGPLVSQATAAVLLEGAEAAAKTRRHEVTTKLELLTKLLGKHLPTWTWQKPEGGLLLWARMPAGDAEELAQVAARHGVTVVPGSANSPDRRFADHVRLPIVADAATMKEGIARLARAAAEYQPRPRATGFDVIV
jgi:DNA-binding transcriptional MocR family regulator